MSGLLLYYWYISKNKIILTLLISLLLSTIAIIEESHEYAIIYFVFAFILITTLDNTKEKKRQSNMEKIMPIDKTEIIYVKYILLIILLLLGLCFAHVYLLLVYKLFKQNLDYKELLYLLWSMAVVGFNLSAINMFKDSMRNYKIIRYLSIIIIVFHIVATYIISNIFTLYDYLPRPYSSFGLQVISILAGILLALSIFWVNVKVNDK